MIEILKDKEREKAKGLYIAPSKEEWKLKPDHRYWEDKRLAQAQLKEDVRQFVEWGEETCPHPIPPFHVNSYYKRTCHICWAELKKQGGIDVKSD